MDLEISAANLKVTNEANKENHQKLSDQTYLIASDLDLHPFTPMWESWADAQEI